MPETPELLERDREITALANAVDLAAGRSARVAAVVGAAGLGKTVLLTEAARLTSEAGFEVLSARGTELEQDFAFGLVRQLYEPMLIRMDEAEREALLTGAAGKAAAAVLSSATPEDAAGDFAILHGLYWLTANVGERQPTALVLDDLHWADTASLRFLAYLLPRLEGLPVAVFVGLRPDGLTAGNLLDQIVTAAETTVLRPPLLSAQASGELVQRVLDTEGADPGFLTACFEATRGNPLLLRDLADMFRAEGLKPTSGNVGTVDVLGPRAVAQRVSLWMARLPADCVELARAAAVLGDGCSVAHAAEQAGMSVDDAVRAKEDLARADVVLNGHEANPIDVVQRIRFSHPLVRATVYEGIDPADRVSAHRQAADLLQRWNGSIEQVASHLLRLPPAHDQNVVELLRRAAREVFAHGSPDTAVTYLRRCLLEPPSNELVAEVQCELGKVMTLVDTNAAAQELFAALELATDPVARAEIAVLLNTALIYVTRFDEAERVCLDALAELPESEIDLRGKLESGLLLMPFLQPRRLDLADRRHTVGDLSGHDNFGSGAIDCLLAGHALWRTEPGSVQLALRGLAAGVDKQLYPTTLATPCAWLVLSGADRDEVFTSIDSAVAQAHQNGSRHGLATAYGFRSCAWLWRGQLVEAEADIREALRYADRTRFEMGHILGPIFLADILMERGKLDEAQSVLDSLNIPDPPPAQGPLFWYLDSRARLLRRQGRIAEALEVALATGRRFRQHGGNNPGFLTWRSEAAVNAHELGLSEQARALAEEDLELAMRWRAPRALGRALRVMGVIRGGEVGLELLQEAIEVLELSPARQEYAAALLELGAVLRKRGARARARRYLTEALEVASTCGADPLRDRARAELRAAGFRPKQEAPSGVASLTPSERRVVDLAAVGHTNREIAEQLFVTVKTVEVHLTNAYRKIGISHRDQLAHALADNGRTRPSALST